MQHAVGNLKLQIKTKGKERADYNKQTKRGSSELELKITKENNHFVNNLLNICIYILYDTPYLLNIKKS